MKKFDIFLIATTCLSIAVTVFLLASNAAQGAEPLTRAEPIVRMILQEANNEPFEGLVAVASVAFDRITDPRWPDSPHGVVYQPYQFSGMGILLRSYTVAQIALARRAVEVAGLGSRPCGRSVFWYHTHAVKPTWNKRLVVACKIGGHIFYKDK